MKHKSLKLVLSILILSGLSMAQTRVPSRLDTNTTWDMAGSPYELTNTVQLAYGTTLIIEPGVVINGNGHTLEVFGTLKGMGSPNNSIRFYNVNLQPGVGKAEKPFRIELNYAYLEKGRFYDPKVKEVFGSLRLINSHLYHVGGNINLWFPIQDCVIVKNIFYNSGSIKVSLDDSRRVNIENNYFYSSNPNSDSGYAIQSMASYDQSRTVVRLNTFANPHATALSLSPGETSAKITAIENFWSSTIEEDITRMIFDNNDDLSVPGKISYWPWLSGRHVNTPKLTSVELDTLGRYFAALSGLPVVSVIPLEVDIPDSVDRVDHKENLTTLIRGEAHTSNKVYLVDFNKERESFSDQEFLNGVKSDSIAREMGRANGATHLITWSLWNSESKYHVDMKYYNIVSGEKKKSRWLRGGVRIRFSVPREKEILAQQVQKSVWVLLGMAPPLGRFPQDTMMSRLWMWSKVKFDSLLFNIEMVYGMAYVGVFLTVLGLAGGYGTYAIISGAGGEDKSDISFPPDYPETL